MLPADQATEEKWQETMHATTKVRIEEREYRSAQGISA